MKNQEDEQQNVASEELEVMKTDLDRKEYLLQQSELKVYHYEKYLQRKGLLDSEARHLLNKFHFDDPESEQTVSNVLSDNLALKEQLKETVQDVNRLEEEKAEAYATINELKAKIKDMKNRQNLAAQALKESIVSPVLPRNESDGLPKVMMVSNLGGR